MDQAYVQDDKRQEPKDHPHFTDEETEAWTG